jgi:AraC-like DNA-binding protein
MSNALLQEQILERADNFFAKGNYLLAKQEYEKHFGGLGNRKIIKKIKLCDTELKKIKAKNITKKARKQLKKSNKENALELFKDAYDLSPEDWIKEQIERLQVELNVNSNINSAKLAETNQDFTKSIELYQQIFEDKKSLEILLPYLMSLIMSKKIDKAKSVFKNEKELINDISILSNLQCYQYGFILMHLSEYSEAVQVWDNVISNNSAFIEQKEALLSLWEKSIYDKYKLGLDKNKLAKEISLFSTYKKSKTISDILLVWKFETIKNLIECKKFKDAIDLLPVYTNDLSNESILFYAQLYYNAIVNKEDVSVFHAVNLIFTVISNPAFTQQYAENQEEASKLKSEFISQITINLEDIDMLTRIYIRYSTYLTLLTNVFDDQKEAKNLIYMPYIADKLNKTNNIYEHLLKDKTFKQMTPLNYKICCSLYGEFSNIFIQIFENNIDFKTLDLQINENNKFVVSMVYYNLLLLDTYNGKPYNIQKYLSKAIEYIQEDNQAMEMLANAIPKDNIKMLIAYEKAFSTIYKKYKLTEARIAVAHLTIDKVRHLNNQKQNIKQYLPALKKALEFLPKEEKSKEIDGFFINSEQDEIYNFVEKSKYNSAAKVAIVSKYEKVKNFFFKDMTAMASIIARDFHEEDRDIKFKQYLIAELKKIKKACDSVDSKKHSIHKLIEKLERNFMS